VTEIQSFIADYVYARRLDDDGNFAVKAASLIAASDQWSVESVTAALRKTKTNLFRLNTGIRKATFTHGLAEQIIRHCGRPVSEKPDNKASIDQSTHFHGTVNAHNLQTGQHAKVINQPGQASAVGKEAKVADLDAFKFIETVKPADVKDVALPLKVPEVQVRKAVETMMGESFHATDSGTEMCDMYTGQATYKGKPVSVAAMFKGAGGNSLRWPLQVAGCGKNGNQVVKLFQVPADLYIVQANGPFDPTLLMHIKDTADAAAGRRRSTVRYILIDGVMTARLLRAVKTGLA
jgi:hypothetical protein